MYHLQVHLAVMVFIQRSLQTRILILVSAPSQLSHSFHNEESGRLKIKDEENCLAVIEPESSPWCKNRLEGMVGGEEKEPQRKD